MPSASQYQPLAAYEDVTVTIASSTTVSNAIDLHGASLVGFFLPSTFDGSTISLQAASSLNGTYVAVQDGAGSDYTLTVAASRYIPIPNLAVTAGLRFIKLVTGTAQTTTDTVITLALRPV
jgi:hypothetical protein